GNRKPLHHQRVGYESDTRCAFAQQPANPRVLALAVACSPYPAVAAGQQVGCLPEVRCEEQALAKRIDRLVPTSRLAVPPPCKVVGFARERLDLRCASVLRDRSIRIVQAKVEVTEREVSEQIH